jgi:hypothetical protein
MRAGVTSSMASANRESQDARSRARSARKMTPPASPPPGPQIVSAMRGLSWKAVTRSIEPSANGSASVSTSCSGTTFRFDIRTSCVRPRSDGTTARRAVKEILAHTTFVRVRLRSLGRRDT